MPTNSLDELRAFVAVVDAGSFTAAAKRLSVTTNAISLRVQRLEEAHGVRLLVRTTRHVAPTDEGRMFHQRVTKVLGELEAAESDLQLRESGLRGTVRIALTPAMATEPFLARLRTLFDRHPKLDVQARITNAPISVAAEGLDIALVVGQLPETTFVGRKLGRATWVLAAAPSYLAKNGRPRTPEDLADHECLRLLSNPPQGEWRLVDRQGRERLVPVRGRFEADDSRALGDAIYAGLGIGVRPLGECARAVKTRRLERVLPGYRFAPLDVYALLPQGRIRIPRVAACLDVLREAMAELS